MVGCCKESQRDVWTLPSSDYAVWNARSMTDWVMQAIPQDMHNLSTSNQQPATPWNTRLWSDLSGVAVDKNVDKPEFQSCLHQLLSTPPQEDFSAWESAEVTQNQPLKTSVSAIAKKAVMVDPLPITSAEEDPDTKREEEVNVSPLRLSELPSRPAFLEEKQLTGAERGTLMHRALSIIPLEKLRGAKNLYGAVKQAVHDMADREIFTYQEVMLLYIKGLAEYFQSELGQRMLNSNNIRREWAFNLLMEEGSLLQGVIDCAFMDDGAWVLVDYKTDRIEDEEAFIQRYQLQIDWYTKALERITGTPVKERYLYSISKGKAYQL